MVSLFNLYNTACPDCGTRIRTYACDLVRFRDPVLESDGTVVTTADYGCPCGRVLALSVRNRPSSFSSAEVRE